MNCLLASVAHRPHTGPMQALVAQYLLRTRPYMPAGARVFRSEAVLFASLLKERGRTFTVLLDRIGSQVSSQAFAALINRHKDVGTQLLVFAVGPADGWSSAALASANTLSLGPMTLPHELARLVLAEQLYRACTILAGHPYHSGH